MVKRPVGGMWKKLKAAALRTLVATPSHAPQTVATTKHADEEDDAERDGRRDLPEREEQQGLGRDQRAGERDAGSDGRPVATER